MANRGADVGADDVAAEQAHRGVVDDRDDVVGNADQRFVLLVDPQRKIGMAEQRNRRLFDRGGPLRVGKR